MKHKTWRNSYCLGGTIGLGGETIDDVMHTGAFSFCVAPLAASLSVRRDDTSLFAHRAQPWRESVPLTRTQRLLAPPSGLTPCP
jgi:hypothetical protein